MLEHVATPTRHLIVRPGELHDVELVRAMHGRCSDLSMVRRFHAPLSIVSTRMARQMLTPTAGWSLVAQQDADIVAVASVAPVSESEVEVGMLVEDRRQRQGLGSRLLHAVATDAAARGYESVRCVTQPDNTAVLATVCRAGLIGRVTWHDGLLQVSVPVRRLRITELPQTA